MYIMMESKSVNQQFRNKDLIEINRCFLGFFFLELQPKRQSFKKHLNCVLLDHRMEEAYKGKNLKATVSYMTCSSRIIIALGKK